MPITRDQKSKEDVDQLHLAIMTAVNKLCASENFITQLSDTIFKSIKEEINKDIETLKQKTEKLEEIVLQQDEIIKSMKKSCDKHEQFIRKNNILIYGLKENVNEDCRTNIINIFNNKLKLNIKISDIERCFRVGKTTTGKCRPLLVKFFNGYHRSVVFQNKKLLKGCQIVIREDLTTEQSKLLKMALEKVGKNGKVWTNFGVIFIKFTNDNNITKIMSSQDLSRI